MKHKSKSYNWMPAALAGLALSASVGFGALPITVNTYDASSSVNGIFSWYGGATFNWDGTQDHTGNSGGSLYISHAAGAGDHIYCPEDFSGNTWDTGTTYDLTTYTNMSMWVKWDTSYSTLGIADFNSSVGGIGISLNDNAGGQYGSWSGSNAHYLSAQAVPNNASNGWVQLNFPISGTIPNINIIGAIIFNNYHSVPWPGDLAFWVDDITFQPSSVTVIPPPTVTPLAKAAKGLNVYASTAGLYDRQSGRLMTNTGKSWVGHATPSNPVSYTFTINSFPQAPSTYGCEAYLFLNPNPAYNDAAPDYNEPNCLIAFIQQGSTNATLTVQYKINDGNDNTMQYGGNRTYTSSTTTNIFDYSMPIGSLPGGAITNVISPGVTVITNESGNLGGVSTAGSAVGKWTITFTSDSNITLTAPDNTTTNLVIPAYNTGYFAETTNFNVYLGMQANNNATINQAVVYSSFAISNTVTPFYENFLTDTYLNTSNVWDTTVAAGQAGVLVVPSTAKYLVTWTLPASGFSLQAGTNLTSMSTWTALSYNSPLSLIGIKSQVIDSSEIPAGKTVFFNLLKRTFTQLQVLLPGETSAPGTLTGKTGTPTPVSLAANTPTDITVNAVDSTYHIISGVYDNIHLTTTDGSAFTPTDTTLANGTVTFSGANGLLFQTQGTQTVSAIDTVSATVTNTAVSSPITVGP